MLPLFSFIRGSEFMFDIWNNSFTFYRYIRNLWIERLKKTWQTLREIDFNRLSDEIDETIIRMISRTKKSKKD